MKSTNDIKNAQILQNARYNDYINTNQDNHDTNGIGIDYSYLRYDNVASSEQFIERNPHKITTLTLDRRKLSQDIQRKSIQNRVLKEEKLRKSIRTNDLKSPYSIKNDPLAFCTPPISNEYIKPGSTMNYYGQNGDNDMMMMMNGESLPSRDNQHLLNKDMEIWLYMKDLNDKIENLSTDTKYIKDLYTDNLDLISKSRSTQQQQQREQQWEQNGGLDIADNGELSEYYNDIHQRDMEIIEHQNNQIKIMQTIIDDNQKIINTLEEELNRHQLQNQKENENMRIYIDKVNQMKLKQGKLLKLIETLQTKIIDQDAQNLVQMEELRVKCSRLFYEAQVKTKQLKDKIQKENKA